MHEISIGDSELEIMKVLWSAETALSSVEIGKAVESRGWKKTTIATFLTRLTEKGALHAEKNGKLYYYTPTISEEDYRRSRTRSLIQNLFGGSAKALALSLFEEESFTETDLAELRSILDETEGDT